MNIIDFLCKIKICATSGEARRLILTKAIKIDDVIIDDPDYVIDEEFYHNVAEDSHLYRWGMNATSTEFYVSN